VQSETVIQIILNKMYEKTLKEARINCPSASSSTDEIIVNSLKAKENNSSAAKIIKSIKIIMPIELPYKMMIVYKHILSISHAVVKIVQGQKGRMDSPIFFKRQHHQHPHP